MRKRKQVSEADVVVFNFPNGGTIKLERETKEEQANKIMDAFTDYYNAEDHTDDFEPTSCVVFRVTEMKAVHTNASHQVFVFTEKELQSIYSYVKGKIEPGDGIPEEYHGEDGPLMHKPN